jgi:hypothetical protein
VTPTDWLAVGEGAIGFALGLLIGVVWMLARVVTAGARARNGAHIRRQ